MNEPRTLRQLLAIAMDKHELSGRQLAFKAQEQGFAITATTINHIRAGRYKSAPAEETIRAIAWLAGVPVEVAFTAAGQPVPGPPLGEELPPGSDRLSPKSRKLVLDMVRVLVDLEGHNRDKQDADRPDFTHTDGELEVQRDDAGQEQKTERSQMDSTVGTGGHRPHIELITAEIITAYAKNHGESGTLDAIWDDPGTRALVDDFASKSDSKTLEDQARQRIRTKLEALLETEDDPTMWPADQYVLAAHPPMELNVERFDRLHGDAGEESQERPNEG